MGGFFEIFKDNQWQCKNNKPFGYYWDFEKKIFFLRVKSLRNIMEIAPIRWKSPLKYFKEIIIKKTPQDKLNEVIQEINSIKKTLSEIPEVQDIVKALITIFKDQTDLKNISFSPVSTKYSDILNEMKILIDDGYLTEVSKKGLGTQNLIIISLFRVMAKYIRDEEKKFIIYGIDEPEIGLHPHSQRQLIFSLKNLSEYSQVIITTHSENLLDITQIDSIIRIGKENNSTKRYKINLTPKVKKILEVEGRDLQEMFFAKSCLIVEGATEEGFFPEASRKVIEKSRESIQKKENYSFDYNSVSVINGRGDNLWVFIKLLKNINTPFIILVDEDKVSNDKDKNSFLDKLKECELIKEEELQNLGKPPNDNDFKNILKKKNIFILPPFEEMISKNLNENALQKVKKAINFVKEQWGYEIENMDLQDDSTDLKEKIFKLLKKNKRWRIGRAIAKELEYNEIPEEYIKIIKKVSKL